MHGRNEKFVQNYGSKTSREQTDRLRHVGVDVSLDHNIKTDQWEIRRKGVE
jgi:hypothetical protein